MEVPNSPFAGVSKERLTEWGTRYATKTMFYRRVSKYLALPRALRPEGLLELCVWVHKHMGREQMEGVLKLSVDDEEARRSILKGVLALATKKD
jgi:hypothetical protein